MIEGGNNVVLPFVDMLEIQESGLFVTISTVP